MAADAVDSHAIGNLRIAIGKDHPTPIQTFHRFADMIARKRHPQRVVAHAGTGGIGHFGGLHMQRGVGKQVQPTRVIIVQMRNDHGVDCIRHQAERLQCGARVHQDGTIAAGGLDLVIAGIDEDRPFPLPQ